ncbi:hypothetical protein [Spirosoma luteum]|uniref:hypothetical protein n=1 Tax=Spirosoma luteum TaxID=431553 RepID=UPI000379304E|nr:hypothetical protein [Spirosoma luteum]
MPSQATSAALEAIHHRLIDSWKRQAHTSLVPMIYPDFKPGSLLFIGINPSLGERDIVNVLKGTEFESFVPNRESVRPYFTFQPELIHGQVADWQAIQAYHRQRLRYFQRHRELAAAVGMPWEQLDLFQLRESAQVNLVTLLQENRTDEFFTEQLTLFYDLLALMAPRAIVVVNGKTGELLKKRWLIDQADESILSPTPQADVFQLTLRGQQIPVIFSVHLQYKPVAERMRINQHVVEQVKRYTSLT